MKSKARVSLKKSLRYLMGYVAGIVYHDEFEWLLTDSGAWEDLHLSDKKTYSAKVHPTKDKAITAAKKYLEEKGAKFPVFVRAYTYETPNPKSAKGMPLYSGDNEREIVTL